MSEHSQKTLDALKCTVIPFRSGNDANDLPVCPSYDRTMAIARHVRDAWESELRHIPGCSDCVRRVQEFQVHLKNTPQMLLEEALRRSYAIRMGPRRIARESTSLSETYGTALYAQFAPGNRDPLSQHRLSWRSTHLLARAVGESDRLSRRDARSLFDICTVALKSNAAAYMTTAHSVDALLPLLECVQEAAWTIVARTSLRRRYIDLWSSMVDDSPLTVRTVMHWGLWELAFRGGEAGDVAIAALRKLLHSTHAHEIAPVAALVFRMHPKISRHFDRRTVVEISTRYSPELVWMLERAEVIKKKLLDIFVACDRQHAAVELTRMFDGEFDKPSLRWQLISTIVVRAGIVQGMRALRQSAPREQDFASTIALGLFRDNTDRSRRSLYADLRVYDALRHRDAVGWSDNLLRLLSQLPDYERHAVVRTVMAAYEDATHNTYDARRPRFAWVQNRWTFVTPVARPFDGFCLGLAHLANRSDDYACHIEWANARFAAAGELRKQALN